MYASVIKREQAKLEVNKKPEKRKRIAKNEIKGDDEMSVQIICAPRCKQKRKETTPLMSVLRKWNIKRNSSG